LAQISGRAISGIQIHPTVQIIPTTYISASVHAPNPNSSTPSTPAALSSLVDSLPPHATLLDSSWRGAAVPLARAAASAWAEALRGGSHRPRPGSKPLAEGVAALLLPWPDQRRGGRPCSPPTGSTTVWPPFFSPDQIDYGIDWIDRFRVVFGCGGRRGRGVAVVSSVPVWISYCFYLLHRNQLTMSSWRTGLALWMADPPLCHCFYLGW
jgi:hypothetical protein